MKCFVPTILSNESWIKTFLRSHSDNTNFDEIVFIVPSRLVDFYNELLVGVFMVRVVDEDLIVKGLSYQSVRTCLTGLGGDSDRSGWYFQQFLKMGICLELCDDEYVVWDIDTLPLNSFSLYSSGKYRFIRKREYHKPYFETIDRLFPGLERGQENVSYIAELMVFRTDIMSSILSILSEQGGGTPWYENILRSIDSKDLSKSGFSEYELYGNYVVKNYPGLYVEVKMRTLRTGSYIVSSDLDENTQRWLAKSFDIVTVENRSLFSFRFISKIPIFQTFCSARALARVSEVFRITIFKLFGKKAIRYDWFD
jgi:hypothetical protein